MRQYHVAFEISGPCAMWTRPDTGAAAVSYPAPTFSAAKGLFECVARLKSAYIRPTAVEICRPLVYHKYVTNYGGPLRKSSQVSGGDSYQLQALVLADVCYRIHGVTEELGPSPDGINHLHYLQERFLRNLEMGRLFSTPFMGWKEFVPDYFGPVRDDSSANPVQSDLTMIIPSMLHSVWDRPSSGRVKPRFVQNLEIREGRLEYAE